MNQSTRILNISEGLSIAIHTLNALMTLKEYLMDYASAETKAIGEALIEAELNNIPKENVREICADHLKKIEEGIRDFRF